MATQYINGIFTEKFSSEALRWALVMTGLETGADASLKQYAQGGNNPLFYAIGTIGYIAIAYVWSLALKNSKLGIVNAYWNGMTNVTNVLIGMSMGETYTIYQGIGILLITAGILLI
jgi:multidrug transporter EmrE-like cation transporter